MAWNVFRFCTALRALGSIMIVLVIGIIGLTYYVVVIADYGPALFHGGLDSLVSFVVLLLFHSLVSSITVSLLFIKKEKKILEVPISSILMNCMMGCFI